MFLRVIPPIRARGKIQMAIDLWLLNQLNQQTDQGLTPNPVLRFYTWEKPTISLGYHQKSYPDHWAGIDSVDIVRRPTGGRAVLHDRDLTYAIIMPSSGKTHRDSYCDICRFLVEGWRSLGRELTFGAAGRGYIHNPSCFGTATAADLITTDGEKFIGSAQLHRGHGILQHGSMLLQVNQALFTEIFATPAPNPPKVLIDQEIIITTLTQAAANCFGLKILSQPLSAEESADVESLANQSLLR